MTSPEAQLPLDDITLQLGAEAYIHYAGGIAILGDPAATQLIHQRELDDLDGIVVNAEQVMIAGLRDIIELANPDNFTRLQRENNYKLAAAPMLGIRNYAYANQLDRLVALNPQFSNVQPLAIRDRVIYGYLAHGRLGKLQTARLLDGFNAAPQFDAILKRRLVTRRGRQLA